MRWGVVYCPHGTEGRPLDQELGRRWVETWQRAGPALDAVRMKELREFDYEEKRHIVLGLVELGFRFRRPRSSSGLVEMQRLLRKMRQ